MIFLPSAGWSLLVNRNYKNVSNFLTKKWSQSLTKFDLRSLMRKFLKQRLTENRSVIYKVVAYGKWSLYVYIYIYERVDSTRF